MNCRCFPSVFNRPFFTLSPFPLRWPFDSILCNLSPFSFSSPRCIDILPNSPFPSKKSHINKKNFCLNKHEVRRKKGERKEPYVCKARRRRRTLLETSKGFAKSQSRFRTEFEKQQLGNKNIFAGKKTCLALRSVSYLVDRQILNLF